MRAIRRLVTSVAAALLFAAIVVSATLCPMSCEAEVCSRVASVASSAHGNDLSGCGRMAVASFDADCGYPTPQIVDLGARGATTERMNATPSSPRIASAAASIRAGARGAPGRQVPLAHHHRSLYTLHSAFLI